MILYAPYEYLPGYRYQPRPRSICPRTGETIYGKMGVIELARDAIKDQAAGRNAPATLRGYECKYCRGWHLTSKKKQEAHP